ncbi:MULTISPECIES: hypothetical protein [Paraburkholderia]|uniref:Small metal-binding protein n=2 Tax=Paraburkholderia TaxID=1822464 RepID=A0A1I3GZ75_9BURK|nr:MULTISPECIES: hypothetical protein [Paraburkholderia]MCX4159992.1 hypothetical protein [Paraburkholderia megapolitana]MDN7155492.1 hypothetical protein [Paraburkholderia sp. CHISQ3]MDQ6492536.1 hypothetical protein [Paraburkholderia megapolitana]PCE25253.1 hypothetical protein BWP39_12065 [Paraburkholderia acidicola]QDQ83116.1 hypothetical protein FNZ07_18040 [Paraburkholderia megapolitana]
MKRFVLSTAVLAATLCSFSTFAQTAPKSTGDRHPNLRVAQGLVAEASTRINDAQKANEWDLGGHAGKARALLVEASDELKKATEAANAHPN